ncbi:uncharacterized protein LOC116167192 isoform X2 [Photinus pyralis]|uniref:uncharacterized protein LOC116162370 isoform X1 n=1 Tax=Photinus pyralis TaxID=7054 RepID=UPI0012676D21|nr:uncharacterized protein LOC116162370 isoform X1 [Photinus pyralis]XP_031331856.1 uncharacterized protein LOC116162370 isoform X1 [Photinus pyralis]XP_031338328.1 uncharacterized protein LOC116167192 isoform X2 [Photinus pyralis]XP_031338334.1 uncharacterized protein LOC116167192 isoform X2 [Photinus pyralis]
MEDKSWTVVLFDDATVEAIPSHWIIGDLCHWPPYPTSKLSDSIKNGDPLNTCWPTLHVKIFRDGTFHDYGIARQKAKVAENTSDLNTDTEDCNKRKRKKKIISSSESESSDTMLPSPPKLKNPKQKDHSRNSEILRKGNQQRKRPNNTRNGESIQIAPKPYESTIVIDPEVSIVENENYGCKLNVEKDKYLKSIAEQVHINRAICMDILSEVKEIKQYIRTRNVQNPEEITFAKKFTNIVFPIISGEQFDTLDAILENEEDLDLLVTDFAKIGGSSSYNFVKRVLLA